MNARFYNTLSTVGLAALLILLSADAMGAERLSEKEKAIAKKLIAKPQSNEDKNNKAADKVVVGKESSSSKLQLATIDISGVDSELKKNIELHMPVTIPICTADRGEVGQFFTNLKKNLRKASRALGYYDAEFRSGGSIVKNCWKLRLKIKPGKPTKISAQNIKVLGEGNKDELFKKILAKPPYEKGDVFNHKKYTDFKTQLSEAAQSLGYFDAEFIRHSIKVSPLSHQASVDLVMNTGKRYRYGKVTVEQKVLSGTTIKNYLLIKEGKLYDTKTLIDQQQLLQRSGYYKLIKVEVLHEQAKNNQVPVNITLTSKKRNAYKYKVGYGSDTGIRVSAEMNRRWTGSKGQQLKAKVQLAQNLSGLSLKLISPRKKPEDDTLVYNFDIQQDKNDDITSQSIDIGGKYTRKLSSDWIQSASIGWLLDKTQVDGDEATRSKLLLFGVGLDKKKADDLLYPNDGWRLKLGLKGAVKGLITDQNVLQLEASAKRILTISKGRFVGRIHIGSTKVENFDALPKSLRFFAGGGRSVRGYRYESLGEIDSNDKVIGGKHVLDLSLEYQHPITESWSVATFIDAGNAFNDIKNPNLKVGIGFGARWRSPIGPVRIDLGFPRGDYKHPQLHLSVGSDL